jgi:hypothetical protein
LLISGRLAIVVAAVSLASSAIAQTDSFTLREAVTIEAIRAHQQALAEIATTNGGTRVSGSPGYDASADYVAEQLREAGYEVTVQPFHFLSFEETEPPQLELLTPEAKSYVAGNDFVTMRNSGAGSVEGLVVPTLDLVIPRPRSRARPAAASPRTSRPRPKLRRSR